MKNLFKKMMLVAVAAMAFVACSQDNDEINATVKKTDVVFNLSIEDVTRAYFGEEQGSGSDTSFPSYWSGNESVTLVAYDADDVVVSTAWGSIEAEGEQATQARVAATFNGELAGVAKVRAYVGSWGYDEPRVPELSQEQYMEKEGTVASNAHTMSAEAAWDGVAPSIDLNFKHAVAYGRMQIKSIVGIDDVNDVTITKAIVKVDEAEYQVTLNSELDTKYIWFACDADEAIETLDIEVKASNGRSYVKTIDMAEKANPLKFRTGEVSKFAVSGLTEKPADYTLDLNKVVARTGNTITFQGDDENDKWTVIFNEGLTEIAEGVYQGVHGAAWSNESALEYDYFNSNFYLAAVPAEYPYYAENAAINVSVEGGIYTISAFVTSYIGGPDKTVQISYVGDLTVEESVPTFSTAVKNANSSDNDKVVVFSGDAGELKLNFYDCNYDNWIDAGVYNIVNWGQGAGQIYGNASSTQYGYYSVDGVNLQAICYGTVTVSIVNGEYHFVFENIGLDADHIYLPYAEFTGAIANITIPDTRTKLATPTNVTYQLEGNMLTLSWDVVDGAVGYYVYDNYHEFEETTTERSITVELTEYRVWYFYVTALAADDSTEYKDSDETYVSFEFADTRPILPAPTNVVVTTDGPNATISWDVVTGADYYLVSYYLNGSKYDVEVTENTVTLELGYSQSVYGNIFSKANDDNPDYQSSQSWDCYVEFTTGKNPDAFADYMYENLSWNSSSKRFELTSNTYGLTNIYLNSSDAPNNNSIKTGTYSYAGNNVSNPGVGTFSLRSLDGSLANSYHAVYDATMTVSFENDEYTILITIVNAGNANVKGKTFGYKGMPDEFAAPDGSIDSGGGDDGQYGSGTQSDPYIYTCSSINASGYYQLTFTSQASGAKQLYLESNTNIVSSFKSGPITAQNNWFPNGCKYANGSITTAWDESTITLTNVSGTIYSFDIKLSTFNGVVYYRCESVNLN